MSRRRLVVRLEAEIDLAEAALWYEDRQAGLGLDFVAEVRAAIRRAVRNPLIYLRLRKRPEVRRLLSRRFPYRILYIVRDDAIVVFAILHAARRDRHWRRRL
ncbi:MAG: type II toxin-antitoxin system RelE/ParE family toxin [Verrucomicrobiota bacterium]